LFAELSSKVIILKNNAPSIITGKGNITTLYFLEKPKLYYLNSPSQSKTPLYL